ncbi:hypothetical protein C8Q75DRAFT_794009 [Abortiporus biennis]|nr:hypothetical protein C8Q75DRAFT_794009 [Abortiporus biennis]
MGNCNKFYKTYSRNKLTGSILVLWCTHSICLSFHSIPFVIYDFACQLAPYCLVREARYFQHTRFLIKLHAHDHTHCGQACFASNMMKFDDCIRTVNTSSVSYMIMEHAAIFTKVFLEVWNRMTIW